MTAFILFLQRWIRVTSLYRYAIFSDDSEKISNRRVARFRTCRTTARTGLPAKLDESLGEAERNGQTNGRHCTHVLHSHEIEVQRKMQGGGRERGQNSQRDWIPESGSCWLHLITSFADGFLDPFWELRRFVIVLSLLPICDCPPSSKTALNVSQYRPVAFYFRFLFLNKSYLSPRVTRDSA